MIVQMTDERGVAEIIEVESYQLKYYEPTNCLQKISYMLVRPPRLLYNEDLLKPQNQLARRYTHSVFYIPFALSLYLPKEVDYVILYLHGNASSRVQGFQQLSKLPKRAGLACFDFNGCGNRLQREFISLGKDEALEVDLAASFLKEKGHRVVGWGRSMGSVSLLLSSQCQIVVADSPFASLRQLCYERVADMTPFVCRPCVCCLFPCLMACVGTDVSQKTKASFDDLEIIQKINTNQNRSILFLAGIQDALIQYRHSQSLYNRFEGRKKMILFEGDHNSDRPFEVLASAYIWIDQQLNESSSGSDMQSKKSTSPFRDSNAKSLSQLALIADGHCNNSSSESPDKIKPDRTTAGSMGERVEEIEGDVKVGQIVEEMKEAD